MLAGCVNVSINTMRCHAGPRLSRPEGGVGTPWSTRPFVGLVSAVGLALALLAGCGAAVPSLSANQVETCLSNDLGITSADEPSPVASATKEMSSIAMRYLPGPTAYPTDAAGLAAARARGAQYVADQLADPTWVRDCAVVAGWWLRYGTFGPGATLVLPSP